MGARLTTRPLPSSQEYLARWSRLHGGAAAAGLVGWWLRTAYRAATPLVRAGAGPDALTVAGLLAAGAGVAAAAPGGRWLLAAAGLVVVSGLLDALDGAVAVLADRTTRWGFVLDSLCDRAAEAAYAAALFVAGAPAALAVLGAALAWIHEYVRARAAAAGMHEIGVVTVSERPTRVLVAGMSLLAAGVYPSASARWAAAGAAAAAALGVVALGQLLVVVHRRLAEP